jgi:4-carboxymuconolactone decarboxylase
MARISLIEADDQPETAELVKKLRSGRRGQLLKLYRLLLHSPPIAASWFEFANAVRWKTELDGRLREIVIVRIALINRVAYMFGQHVPQLTLAEGLTEKECGALADWRPTEEFSPRERAALAYADAMTRDVVVPDAVFNEIRRHLTERQMLELTVLIAAYNMHSRVMQALELEPETSAS